MSETRSAAVVLSPHLDDAIFSCPGWIQESALEGEYPLVLTLFSHAHAEANLAVRETYATRQREDEEATKLVGARRRLAGFVDAPFRCDAYRTLSGVLCGPTDFEPTLLPQIGGYLQDLLDELHPKRVLAPLGIGQHIDHRITQEIVTELAPQYPTTDFIFYEDRPYAFVDEAVRLRLAQLCRSSTAMDFQSRTPAERSERFFLSFYGAPYARQHMRSTDQPRIVAHVLEAFVRSLQEPTEPVQAVMHEWSPDILRDLLPALDAYASKAQGFLGSGLYHQWAALEYARRLGLPGRYVERTWQL